METIKCIEARRSVRSFTDQPVQREKIEKMVACAQLAPTWKNTQTARFTAVTDKGVLSEICDTLEDWNRKIVSGAPLLMLVSAVTGRSAFEKDGSPSSKYGEGYTFFDCGAVTENLCLAAKDLGLDTVILGIFSPDKIEKIVKTPENEHILVLVACGYGQGEPPTSSRRAMEEVLRFI